MKKLLIGAFLTMLYVPDLFAFNCYTHCTANYCGKGPRKNWLECYEHCAHSHRNKITNCIAAALQGKNIHKKEMKALNLKH